MWRPCNHHHKQHDHHHYHHHHHHHLVTGDELVAEAEAGHQTALLQPEDGGKAPGEENALKCEKLQLKIKFTANESQVSDT